MAAPRHIPWSEPVPPAPGALERRLLAEGLDFYSWSNAPFDVYVPHSHHFDKVLYCVRGSITFQLVELGAWYKLLPGDRLELPAGIMHAAEVGEDGVVRLEAHV